MALTKYTLRRPGLTAWPELESNRLSRLFDDAFFTPVRSGGWSPAISVVEGADALELSAELPGLKEEDVNIELEHNRLTISGEKTEARSEDDEGRKVHVFERSYGSFKRSFTLPRTIDSDAISARYENGVLHITLPKAAESKGRRIEITQ
ncbi:MAG: Hsp20/alpha crystallin family protein [Gemmatimonadota bacterium]